MPRNEEPPLKYDSVGILGCLFKSQQCVTIATDVFHKIFSIFAFFLLAQVFVLAVTMCREAFDDFIRFLRDQEVNSQVYKKLTKKGN